MRLSLNLVCTLALSHTLPDSQNGVMAASDLPKAAAAAATPQGIEECGLRITLWGETAACGGLRGPARCDEPSLAGRPERVQVCLSVLCRDIISVCLKLPKIPYSSIRIRTRLPNSKHTDRVVGRQQGIYCDVCRMPFEKKLGAMDSLTLFVHADGRRVQSLATNRPDLGAFRFVAFLKFRPSTFVASRNVNQRHRLARSG